MNIENCSNRFRIYWLTDLHLLANTPILPHSQFGVRHGILNIWAAEQRLAQFVQYVNRDRPNLALCTGDLIDSQALWLARARDDLDLDGLIPASAEIDTMLNSYNAEANLQLFSKYWSQIPPEVPSAVVPGNHDIMALSVSELADQLGRRHAPVVAGSIFNESRSLSNGQIAVRLVMVDSNHWNEATWCYTGRLSLGGRDWIANELLKCKESIAFICMHHGPHRYDTRDPQSKVLPWPQFDEADAMALQGVIEQTIKERPELRIWILFGHEHGNKELRVFKNLGPCLPGVLSPCVVDYEVGLFTVITIDNDGGVRFDVRSLN